MADEKKALTSSIEKETVASAAPSKASLSRSIVIEKGAKARTKSYVLDLRIHSPASLGYLSIEGIDTAPALVRLAKVKGLDVIAVTDFYSGSFIDRVVAASRESDLVVIPGVDLRCVVDGCSDATMTCIFPRDFTTSMVEEFLATIGVPAEARGKKDYLLTTPFENILKSVEMVGGNIIPSRMDKTPHRLNAIPTLVERYGFRSFDLAYGDTTAYFKRNWPKVKFNLYSFSNAYALAQVGSRTAKVKLADPSFTALSNLLRRDGVAEKALPQIIPPAIAATEIETRE